MPENKEQNNIYIISSSIIVAGLLIAGAVLYDSGSLKNKEQANVAESLNGKTEVSVSPISNTDHIIGDINAPVKIFEYSDFECPFCSRFQETMIKEIKPEYIDSGKVVWVYRHLPLAMHAGSEKKAEASECVAELGGNDAFWKLADKFFKDEQIEVSKLGSIVKSLGLDEKAFTTCLDSGKYAADVKTDLEEASRNGIEATPFSLIFNEKGFVYSIPGAYPANDDNTKGIKGIKTILNEALKK